MPADAAEIVRLAERVEQATGPDRELDVRISLALSGVSYSDTDVADLLTVRDEPTGYGRYRPADEYIPAHTASLDAAMTLVPSGHTFTLLPGGEDVRLAQVWRVSRAYCGFGVDIPESRCLTCLLYTSPSPRDVEESRMPSSA